ncbi:MAG TPA: serine/threonine-protein kinase [Usitatibacter sp.]|jgi:serine/threonine-protein kinase|nr:serine/threonine-protein kinase [Usitatibacter sp.]
MSSEPLPSHFGRFRVLGELGRGAMGVVYRAEDATLGRVVAVKTISLSGSSKQERDVHEARFLQEARAAASLAHPTIITIYEMGREGDTAFIAMELLEGRELREMIRDVSLAPAESLRIIATVAEGLAYAHQHGVIHRDIKPGNIMVLPDGRVKIMDFGIARHREPMVKTQTGVLLGSPQYMSPEQIVGKPFDHRADLFALGLVLYEMLTGVKPFAGEDIPDLTFKVANMAATPPSHLAPDLPPVIDMIVARALKKIPGERYQSGADLARDLRAALPEVEAADAQARQRADAETVPQAPLAASGGAARTMPFADEVHELRPSPRFDGSAALERLPVRGAQDPSATQSAPIARRKARPAPASMLLVAAYAAALVVAMIIAFG